MIWKLQQPLKISRRLGHWSSLLLVCAAALAAATAISPLENDGVLTAKLESFRFIQGKQLERLKSGQSVAYDFSLQIFDGPRSVGRSLERFVISYDLWEENFSVSQLSALTPKLPKAGISHLKLEAVGDWCLDHVRLSTSGLDKSRNYSLQLEVRSVGPKLPNPLRAEGSVDLNTMVEIFSRPASAQEFRYFSESRSFRLGATRQP